LKIPPHRFLCFFLSGKKEEKSINPLFHIRRIILR
jgi:hypothetical protein